MKSSLIAACLLALMRPVPAAADVTVLLCEPYGRYGLLVPQGHISVYFDRICADSPARLRGCHPGEAGAVVSRYNGIAGLDWIAMPLIPWLYAVDRAADVPEHADRARVEALRNAYREANFRDLVPDAPGGKPPKGNWYQLVGSTYDRRIVAYTLRTTVEQDAAMMEFLNTGPNRSRWNWVLHNCADFVQDLVNRYHPGAMKTSAIGDLGLTTPKQVVKSLVKFCGRRPDLELRGFVISQIPGSRKATRAPRGVLESLVMKPMYLVPLVIVQPWVPVALAGGYLVDGRFNPHQGVTMTYEPGALEGWALAAATAASDASASPSDPATPLPSSRIEWK